MPSSGKGSASLGKKSPASSKPAAAKPGPSAAKPSPSAAKPGPSAAKPSPSAAKQGQAAAKQGSPAAKQGQAAANKPGSPADKSGQSPAATAKSAAANKQGQGASGTNQPPPVEDLEKQNQEKEQELEKYEGLAAKITQDAITRYELAESKANRDQEQARKEKTEVEVRDKLKKEQAELVQQTKLTVSKQITEELQQSNLLESTKETILKQQLDILDAALKKLQARETIQNTKLLQKQQSLTDSQTALAYTTKSTDEQENTRKNYLFFFGLIKSLGKTLRALWLWLVYYPLREILKFIKKAWPIIKQVALALFTFLFNHRKSAFAPYFTLFLVICLILGLIGLVALATSEPDPVEETEPAAPPIEDTDEGPMWVLPDGVKIPVIEGELPPMPTIEKPSWFSMPTFSTPRFLKDLLDRFVPTYKASMIAQNLAPYTSPIHVPELQTTPREKIVGRCDNLKYMETSLKSGEGGMCTTTDVPAPITWVMDITKSDDYKNLPDQIKRRIGTDGSKNKVTIPWKSDGFVYSPDCEKATFADGTPANLYNDHGEYCKKKEVDKIKYNEAWRIRKEFDFYKGIDVFE